MYICNLSLLLIFLFEAFFMQHLLAFIDKKLINRFSKIIKFFYSFLNYFTVQLTKWEIRPTREHLWMYFVRWVLKKVQSESFKHKLQIYPYISFAYLLTPCLEIILYSSASFSTPSISAFRFLIGDSSLADLIGIDIEKFNFFYFDGSVYSKRFIQLWAKINFSYATVFSNRGYSNQRREHIEDAELVIIGLKETVRILMVYPALIPI